MRKRNRRCMVLKHRQQYSVCDVQQAKKRDVVQLRSRGGDAASRGGCATVSARKVFQTLRDNAPMR